MVNSRVMVGLGRRLGPPDVHHHATTRLEHILNKINLGGVEQGVFNPRPAPVTTATTAARHAAHPGRCSTLVCRAQAATHGVLIVFNPPVILFNLFLILFKLAEDLVQPPPTRST